MKTPRLFTPGPTEVPVEVREAFAGPMIHHRSSEFGEILRRVRDRVGWLCGCDGEIALLSSSGSGGMEASVASLFAPGDEVVVVVGGKFGERWKELADHYRLKSVTIAVEWGRAVAVEAVLRTVTPSTKGILIQGCETSTGAYHPIAEIGHALRGRGDLLFVVDAITALGIHDLDMERDRIDVLVGASQKAFMSPPGAAVVALSRRALQRMLDPGGSYYFSLAREVAAAKKNQTGFTPAISNIVALDAALARIEREGKPALFARHLELQRLARASLREMGLHLFNRDEEATVGITVAHAQEGLDVKGWIQGLRTKEGLWLAGGQGKLEGKIFRLAHFGAITKKDLLWALDRIRESLA
ncbi:MAG: alanine--glyoxylate aminotransferase family protein [Pseudomonadota bacterium]